MFDWWRRRREAQLLSQRAIPDELWLATLADYPFLQHRSLAHLARLRELQDQTRGFTAFICWPFQSANTRLAPGDGSAHAYLRTNALARLFLDDVPNLQASWVTMGGGVAQAALHMGCNDFGSVMIEENVVSAAGTTFKMDSEEVERHIRDAGFTPARRNMRYQIVGGGAFLALGLRIELFRAGSAAE